MDNVIEVEELIEAVEYDYPECHLSMDCFWFNSKSGKLIFLEVEDSRWLTKEKLDTVGWLPANRGSGKDKDMIEDSLKSVIVNLSLYLMKMNIGTIEIDLIMHLKYDCFPYVFCAS